ncbi:MAG: hypothetical protein IPN38_19095 [Flavobacteriales bacterium]|nr:hypothetical protein [Flavobacteriales bacterium]
MVMLKVTPTGRDDALLQFRAKQGEEDGEQEPQATSLLSGLKGWWWRRCL